VRTEEIVEVKTAVAVTEEALRLLCQRIDQLAAEAEPDRLSGRRPQVLYHGELVGGNKFTFETAEELLEYQNRHDRRITTLFISLSGGFGSNRISVTISEDGGTYAFKGSAGGEVGEALRVRHYLEDFAAAIRAPWAWMWWNSGNILFGALLLTLFLGYGLLAFYASDKPSPAVSDARAMGYSGLITFGFFAALFLLYQMRKKFFPRAILALGQERTRYESLKKWHWLPIAAVAGLVVKVVYDWISK
jgi:hypothetical protein